MSNLKSVSNICVISKTLLKNKFLQDYTSTHNALRNIARIYPGCIYSLNSIKDNYYTNISVWSSQHMWKNWYNSSDRYYITNKFNNNILNENIEIFNCK